MARFILQSDYGMQIKAEIIRLLTANTIDWYVSAKLIRAEQTAIHQIKNRIGKRYDCDEIFTPGDELNDLRDQWIVTITIDIALYHLYSQTGMKDIPEHRANRYQDAIDWLKDVGNGTTPTDLPTVKDDEGEEYSEVVINSRPPENHKW
ncbi:phage protein Gp36 family protein [Limibacterium fermenti]|uniref:phage protein Gp36 family protein n=1 Tax=Limibacterium fermenti TaxID=3229863 RepID=UPI003A61F5FA